MLKEDLAHSIAIRTRTETSKEWWKKKSDRNIEKRKIEYNKKEQAIEYSSLSHSHMLKHPLFQMETENNIT